MPNGRPPHRIAATPLRRRRQLAVAARGGSEQPHEGPSHHVDAAEARGGAFEYYEVWLETFERILASKGVVTPTEVEESTFQFEFGERDDVF